MTTFNKIDRDSANAISSALSFFEIPPTNVSVSNSTTMELLTLNPVQIQPLHFKIHASSNYIDLTKCYVYIQGRIRKYNAQNQLVNLARDENVSVINMLGNTLWKNCRVSINGTQVFEGNSLMAYKSIFGYTLSYPETVKNSYLSVAGYYTDGDKLTEGPGHDARKGLFSESKVVELMAKLDVDICHQPRYLVNQCEVDIELLQNDDNFIIVAPDASEDTRYHFELLACKLYCKKLELMDSLAYDLNKRLELKPARYPIKKTTIKSLFISENRTEYTANLWSDQVPTRVTLAMVKNDNFIGNLKNSPFQFEPFDVRDISIMANGVMYPAAPYSNLNFPKGLYARPYHDMQDAVGMAGSLDSNAISMSKYGFGGHCFFVFNLTSSGEDNGPETLDLIQNGTTHVKISFNSPVPERGIVLLAMSEVDSLLIMNRDRVVSSDVQI